MDSSTEAANNLISELRKKPGLEKQISHTEEIIIITSNIREKQPLPLPR